MLCTSLYEDDLLTPIDGSARLPAITSSSPPDPDALEPAERRSRRIRIRHENRMKRMRKRTRATAWDEKKVEIATTTSALLTTPNKIDPESLVAIASTHGQAMTSAALTTSTSTTPALPSTATSTSASWIPTYTFTEDGEVKLKEMSAEERLEMLKQHDAWVDAFGDVTVGDLVEPVCDLLHASNEFTSRVWVALFPEAWSKLGNDDRQALAQPITQLLSRDWHSKLASERPNPIQALLEAFSHCHPLPDLPPELLRFLGKTYNAWFHAISQLESRLLSIDAQISANAGINNALYDALTGIYKNLCENDLVCGLWRRRAASEHSRAALAYEQHGMWVRAQEMLYSAMVRTHAPQYTSLSPEQIQHDPVLHDLSQVNRVESVMWEEEWVRCCRHLNQWEVLYEFSCTIQHPELVLDCSWRLGKWDVLKDYISKAHASGNMEPIHSKLYLIYLSLHDRGMLPKEMERLCEQGLQIALREWQQLPPFVMNAHLPLFQRFQRLVELQESAQMIVDINNSQRANQLPPFKNFITTWRERLANKWEEIPVWSDILTWRQHMFTIITQIYPTGPDSQVAYSRIHDTPWTVIKFAQTARKQQLPSVCLKLLSSLAHIPTIDAPDAFTKLREQIKICLSSPVELNSALNLISSTNLEYFNQEQKAEMFRLKGEALQALGYGDESNTAFSASLSICDTYGKGWFSWGIFCDRVYTLKKDLQWAEHAVVCYLQAITHKNQRSRMTIARVLWLLSSDKDGGPVNRAFSRFADHVPPWIWLLWIPQLITSLPRPEGITVRGILLKLARSYPQALYYTMRSQQFEKREQQQATKEKAQIENEQQDANATQQTTEVKENGVSTSSAPTTTATATASASAPTTSTDTSASLTSTTSATMQTDATPSSLATAPAALAPVQPIKQEEGAALAQAQSQGQTSTVPATSSTSTTTTPASDAASASSSSSQSTADSKSQAEQQRLAALQAAGMGPYAFQWTEEIVSFLRRTSPSLINEIERICDEFQRRFKSSPCDELLGAVHALIFKCFRYPVTSADTIQPAVAQMIERVAKKFFSQDPSNPKHQAFLIKYKASFERDFLLTTHDKNIPNPHFPTTVTELIQRLKKWQTLLKYIVGDSIDLQLERLSTYLVRFESHDVEIPGQYLNLDAEPHLEMNTILSRFDTSVHVRHSHGFSHRRIGMIGNDGRTYYFLLQYSISHMIRADERNMQMYTILNKMLAKFKETRKRDLAYHASIVIPLSTRFRLMETHPSQITLEEIYDQSCAIRNVDADEPNFFYRDAIRKASGNESNAAARLKVYNDICQSLVPDSIFSHHFYQSIPHSDQLWAFKKQLCTQLALSGFLSYIMKIGDRTLHKMSIYKHTGKIANSEFMCSYNDQHLVESSESVPFRLTRNLTNFLSPFLIDGLFSTVIMTCTSCLISNQEVLKNYFCLLVRDDLLSWLITRLNINNDSIQRKLEQQLRDKIGHNAGYILRRMQMLMPNPPDKNAPPAQQQMPVPANLKVHQLIRVATAKSKLSLMNPTWSPWV